MLCNSDSIQLSLNCVKVRLRHTEYFKEHIVTSMRSEILLMKMKILKQNCNFLKMSMLKSSSVVDFFGSVK